MAVFYADDAASITEFQKLKVQLAYGGRSHKTPQPHHQFQKLKVQLAYGGLIGIVLIILSPKFQKLKVQLAYGGTKVLAASPTPVVFQKLKVQLAYGGNARGVKPKKGVVSEAESSISLWR